MPAGDADLGAVGGGKRRRVRRHGGPASAKTSNGSAAPTANDSVSAMVGSPIVPVAPAMTMAASTGPAHGTYSTPSARPSPKPLLPWRALPLRDARETASPGAPRTAGRSARRRSTVSATSADPADCVLRQVQQRQQRGTDQRDDGEAQHQTGDHPVRPQRLGQRRLGLDLGRDCRRRLRRTRRERSVRRRRRSPAAREGCTARSR